jgi:hypothetical protein
MTARAGTARARVRVHTRVGTHARVCVGVFLGGGGILAEGIGDPSRLGRRLGRDIHPIRVLRRPRVAHLSVRMRASVRERVRASVCVCVGTACAADSKDPHTEARTRGSAAAPSARDACKRARVHRRLRRHGRACASRARTCACAASSDRSPPLPLPRASGATGSARGGSAPVGVRRAGADPDGWCGPG